MSEKKTNQQSGKELTETQKQIRIAVIGFAILELIGFVIIFYFKFRR